MKTLASYSLVKTMRASILVLGPLIQNFIDLPYILVAVILGQPVNYHLSALKKLGMQYQIKKGYIHAKSNGGLTGKQLSFQRLCWSYRKYNYCAGLVRVELF